jgi:hypothetical protein
MHTPHLIKFDHVITHDVTVEPAVAAKFELLIYKYTNQGRSDRLPLSKAAHGSASESTVVTRHNLPVHLLVRG